MAPIYSCGCEVDKPHHCENSISSDIKFALAMLFILVIPFVVYTIGRLTQDNNVPQPKVTTETTPSSCTCTCN